MLSGAAALTLYASPLWIFWGKYLRVSAGGDAFKREKKMVSSTTLNVWSIKGLGECLGI